MTDTKSLFENARSKIQRAHRHIDELTRRSSPLDRELYELSNPEHQLRKTVIDLHPTVYRVAFRPKEDIPMTFAGVIGDAFNNIREAFDYAAVAIVDTWGQRPSGNLYFPITKRKDLVSHTGFTAIEQAIPGFADLFLREIRPENGPNEHLWDFYTLHKDGKHNDFIPVVTVANIAPINARSGGLTINQCAVGFDASRPFIIIQSQVPITMNNDFQTSVDIKFGKGTSFEDKPVIPTLKHVSHIASETIDWLARLIKRVKDVT